MPLKSGRNWAWGMISGNNGYSTTETSSIVCVYLGFVDVRLAILWVGVSSTGSALAAEQISRPLDPSQNLPTECG